MEFIHSSLTCLLAINSPYALLVCIYTGHFKREKQIKMSARKSLHYEVSEALSYRTVHGSFNNFTEGPEALRHKHGTSYHFVHPHLL